MSDATGERNLLVEENERLRRRVAELEAETRRSLTTESERRYRTLAESLPHLVWTCRADGPCDHLSPRWVEYTGIPEADQLGYRWLEQVHPDDRDRVLTEWSEVAPRGVFEIEFRIRRADGAYRWFKTRAIPFLDNNGQVVKWFGSNSDIDDQKRVDEALRESEELYRSLFDNMMNGLAYCKMLFDQGRPVDFIYLGVNQAFETQTGLKGVVGRKVSEVIPGIRESNPELFETYGRVAVTGRPEVFEIQVEALDNMWFSVSVYSPKREHFVAVFDVITERKRAEETVHAAERRFRSTLDGMIEGCQLLGHDWRYLYINGAAEAHNRRPSHELLGNRYMDVWPGIEATEVFVRIRRSLVDRIVDHMENEFSFPDGTQGWFDLRFEPVPEGVIILSMDITEQRRAEAAQRESQQRLHRFYESGLLGVIFWNMRGQITDANDKFLEMVGYTRAELNAGQIDWLNMTPPEYRHLDEASIAELKATGVNRKPLEKEYLHKDGTRIPIAVAGAMLDEERANGVAFVQDITERVRAEKTVRLLNTELEQRIRDRTAQLEESNRELEAFSYSVSHDLRAPLRAIDGFTRILAEEYAAHLDAEGKRLCAVVRENANGMGQLIDDLLAFSRLGRAEMKLSVIDMAGMASAVFHELTTVESRPRIDFQLGPLPTGVADPTLMRQVWMNLIANAIKFSSKVERATIKVSARQSQGECVYTVQDNGAGFEMEYVGKLFGVFQRLHSANEFEGTGVGLALVQRIIRRHGGRVWAEGEPDKGATFHFALQERGPGS